MADDEGAAEYVFAVEFRLAPGSKGVATDPKRFETTLFRRADPPGEEGWLFFRDNLWRGELGDERHFREVTEEALGVSVTRASFRELRTDEAYLDALRSAVGDDLAAFRADTVEAALTKYLGSSIHVVDREDIRAG